MAEYILKIIDTEEIVSTFEWDGVGDLEAPFGYEIELLTDEITQFVSYTASLLDSSSMNTEESLFIGDHRGTFFGDILGATIFGKPISNLINSTEYGTLDRLIQINNSYTLANTSSWFNILDEDVILLSGNNHNTEYSRSLAEIVNTNKSNYVLKLKSNTTPSEKLEYLVKNTHFSDIGEYGIYELNVVPIKSKVFEYFQTIDLDGGTETWHIDFDFNTYENTGSFTGSFFGNFDGFLNGTSSYSETASYAEYSEYSEISNFTENASTIEVITSTQFWTKPSWAKTIRVTLVGGGGGGGSAPATEDQFYLIGGGGGGGGTVTIAEYDADTLDESIWVFVGAGGLGGTNLTLASNGGSSMFGNLLVARGGNAGQNGKIEFGPGSLGWGFVQGGTSIGKIDYINTGGGGGGAGTINGIIPGLIENAAYASLAPTLPIIDSWLDLPDRGDPTLNYYTTWPIPIPASIAPTGGGGGTGYDPNNGRQTANTFGGTIIGWLPYNLRYEDVLTAYTYYGGSLPAFNSKIGIGGNGGNAYDLSRPTHGADYGGGGGGAYSGGSINGSGVYPDGTPTYTDYNFGANGANGVVVIISET